MSKPGGHHVHIRKGFGTQGSAGFVVDLYWTFADHLNRLCCDEGDTSGKLEEVELHEGAPQAEQMAQALFSGFP